MSPLIAVTVRGPSMEPSLAHGRTVIVLRGRTRIGDVVVVERPDVLVPARWDSAPLSRSVGVTAWLVKRLVAGPGDPVPEAVRDVVTASVVPDGAVVLLGDNPSVSYDSRQAGFFPRDRILGRVLGLRRVSRLDARLYGGAVGWTANPGNRPGRTG